jgi:nucleoside-diphosphate-sugar epimerase
MQALKGMSRIKWLFSWKRDTMSKNASKILVTGGAGFIGSHLIPRLIENGCSVTVLDNLSSGKKENLNQLLNHPRFRLIVQDIRDHSLSRDALKDVDMLVHLAAQIDVTASVADPALTNDINVTGTLNMLKEAAKSRVRRFVFASSTAVYGDAKEMPVKEDTPLRPISPYAASKAAAEAYCSAFTTSFGIETVALRFFNVYGPKNENSPYSGVITKFLRQALRGEVLTVEGDGEQTRDFIHVSDVAEALTLAVSARGIRSETINICTGVPTSVNGLVTALGKVTERNLRVKHAPARVGDVRFSYGDGSKAAQKLGFKPQINILKGLALLYEQQKLTL